MKILHRWIIHALQAALILGLAAVARWWFGIPFFVGIIIGFFAIVINSFILNWEGNQPGGFNNPR